MTTHATTPTRNWAPFGTGQSERHATSPEADPTGQAPAPRQPALQASARTTPWDWLFPSFFLCMVVAVLPLTGLQWTYPEGATARQALGDSMLLSLPIFIPLPFLLTGCLVALAVQPATRTPAALGFFGVGVLVGLAGLQAILAIL